MSYQKIINLADGIDPNDAVNLSQINNIIEHRTINENLNLNHNKISNLKAGISDLDAVNIF